MTHLQIVVLGAGEVGFDVAQMLSREDHDVVVVDASAEPLDRVGSRLDVLTIHGHGTSADVLREARAQNADLIVAVTSVDEVNIIACMLAKRMGARVTIARVRSGEYSQRGAVLKSSDLGIDKLIYPSESTAEEIIRLIRRASATDVLNFASNRLQLVGIRLDETCPLLWKPINEIAKETTDFRFRVMGISRGVRTIVPHGEDRLHKNDQVFVLIRPEDYSKMVSLFGKTDDKVHELMILGGTLIGARVAQSLSGDKRIRVKLLESDRARAEQLADELKKVLVIHGEASDLDLLAAEGITEMDAFVAVRDDEASNLVTCLMAKHLGVPKTVALLSTAAYLPVSQRIGIDASVNKKLAVSREVLRFLRAKHVLSLATVHGLDAEILELQVGAHAPVSKGSLREQERLEGIVIGAVITDAGVEIAAGDTVLKEGDRSIVFSLPSRVSDVERLFQAN